MKNNNGTYLEKLVQVIEQSLLPDSVVEHNVRLPVLNSKTGETTQCDLVIKTGKVPRQTITIVEIQDRNRAVEINDFRGWLSKMHLVGAQHLYCVSRKEFPNSIKEQAALSGNTVKLITLKEINAEAIPLKFFQYTFLFLEPDILHIKKKELIVDAAILSSCGLTLEKFKADMKMLKTNDKKFCVDRMTLHALSTFCIRDTPIDAARMRGTGESALGYEENKPLYFYTHGVFVPVKLTIEYSWAVKKIKIPTTILSYSQDEYGALAWVLEGYYQSPRGPVSFKMPVTKCEDGSYKISNAFLTFPYDTDITFRLEKFQGSQKMVYEGVDRSS